MMELARYAFRRRLLGTAALSVLLSVFAAGMVAMFPSIDASGVDLEAYLEAFPPALREAFGLTALGSIEGFLSAEFYQFGLVLLLGLYTAYVGGRLVAAEVETGRIDFVLAGPVPRWRVVVERYLALLASVVVVDVVSAVAVVVSVAAIGDSIEPVRLLWVHLLAVPYLAACGGLGLLISTLTDRADTAQRAGLGAVFVLFVLDSTTAATDYDWLGAVSPTRLYDPTAVLVEGTVDLAGAGLLLAASAVLVVAAVKRFRANDI
jgi:ABC-2 type transport system permease protein